MIKQKISFGEHLLQTVRGILYGFVFLFPLFFLPFTLDLLEVNKQTLLLLCVCVATLLWFGSILANKTVTFRLTWMNWMPMLFALALGVSAWFSLSPFNSWIGSSGTEYTSVMTIGALCLLFFLLTQTIDKADQYKKLFFFAMGGSVLTGIIAILSIGSISVFPFLHLTPQMMFNTVGTLSSLAVFLIVMCVFLLGNFFVLNAEKTGHDLSLRAIAISVFTIVLLLETFFLLLALNYGWLWFLLIFGFGIQFAFLFFRSKSIVSISKLLLPVAMMLFGLLFWIGLPSPLSTKLPVEVSLNFGMSLDILQKTFAQHSFIYGTGPGTYAINYSAYHGDSINQTNFWNTRFDRATSFVLTLATESGILGFIAYLLLVVGLCLFALFRIIREKQDNESQEIAHLFLPWFTIVLASFLFPFNMTLMILLFVLSGLLAFRLVKKEKNIAFAHSSLLAFGSSALFILFTLALFFGIFLATERYAAEIAYAKAVRSDRANMDVKTLVTQLDRAATLNQYDDGAYRNLAEALILRVNEELKSAPTNSQLNDSSKKYIQSLVAAAVNAAVHATDLSPFNVTNWLVRGEVYRSLASVVPHAADFSRDAYKRATQLEPNNPNNWMELGKTYLIAADAAQALTVAKDTKIADTSKKEVKTALENAQVSFEKAIVLKSNFAPAHFQLGLVFKREGKLDQAIGKIENVAQYNTSDVGVAFELGVLYLQRNGSDDLARAQNAFQHVISLTPSYSNAHWYLASIYEKQGKHDLAIKEIETVAKLNPGNQIVKARLDKLRIGQVSPIVTPLPDEKKK